jgi:hypothetical protein
MVAFMALQPSWYQRRALTGVILRADWQQWHEACCWAALVRHSRAAWCRCRTGARLCSCSGGVSCARCASRHCLNCLIGRHRNR